MIEFYIRIICINYLFLIFITLLYHKLLIREKLPNINYKKCNYIISVRNDLFVQYYHTVVSKNGSFLNSCPSIDSLRVKVI